MDHVTSLLQTHIGTTDLLLIVNWKKHSDTHTCCTVNTIGIIETLVCALIMEG